MRLFYALAGAILFCAHSACGAAIADPVEITVDLTKQSMHVEAASGSYDWDVSTGRTGFETQDGHYGVSWMDKDHYSKEYDDAHMPYAIFFGTRGQAIHGFARSKWGHPASHGCVRLPLDHAAELFDWVKAYGAKIAIINPPPPSVMAKMSRPDHRTARHVDRDYDYVPDDEYIVHFKPHSVYRPYDGDDYPY